MSKQKFVNMVVRCAVLACSICILALYVSISSSPVEAESPAFLRVVHASPDVGTVDVFMDGKKLLSSFQYASVSNYLPLPPGPHSIEIALIGKGINAPVITQILPVNAGKAYTIAAVGMQSTRSLAVEVFEDDNTIVGNSAKVRIYHLSPGTGSVDVSEDTNKVAGNVGYSQASNYASIPAGRYTFNVTLASANKTIPISAQLNQWTVTSFFAIGLLNGNPQLTLVTTQTTGTPALPQTGGGPVAHAGGAPYLIVWCLALIGCLVTFGVIKNHGWAKVWLNIKRK